MRHYNEPYGCCEEPVLNETKSYSTLEKLCYLIERVKELVAEVLGFQGQIDELDETKEDSVNITDNRKLSEDGDFTGSIHGQDSLITIAKIDTNSDAIDFLTDQFEDGATGLVIECGFFGDDDIDKGYDGGVW
jgi:hypothetical protein